MLHVLIEWSLLFSTVALIVTTVRMAINRSLFPPLASGTPDTTRELSIMIPARNEERSLPRLLSSLRNIHDPAMEILILDDQSTDATPELLEAFRQEDPDRRKILSGEPLPDGWLGKPWACHQLSREASGDLLLFLDADVTLHPDAISRLRKEMESHPSDLLTVWPIQELGSRWEKVLLPLIYHALVTLLPIEAMNRRPWWMPSFLYRPLSPLFGAACGQCLLFTRESYGSIDGHVAVKQEVVEDVMLARAILAANRSIRMVTGHESVSCRMYHSEREIHAGLRKNFLAGFDYRIPLFLLSGLVHAVIHAVPFLMLPVGIWIQEPFWILFSALSVVLILLQRLWLAVWFGWNPIYAWTHPIAVGWFQLLGVQSIADRLRGTSVHWKGRPV